MYTSTYLNTEKEQPYRVTTRSTSLSCCRPSGGTGSSGSPKPVMSRPVILSARPSRRRSSAGNCCWNKREKLNPCGEIGPPPRTALGCTEGGHHVHVSTPEDGKLRASLENRPRRVGNMGPERGSGGMAGWPSQPLAMGGFARRLSMCGVSRSACGHTGQLTLFYKCDVVHSAFDNVGFWSKDEIVFVEDAGDTLHT